DVLTGKHLSTVTIDPDDSLRSWRPSRSGMHWSGSYLALSPDGLTLAIAGHHLQVDLWRLDGKSKPRQVKLRVVENHWGVVETLTFSPDGKTLLVNVENALQLYDVATGAEKLPMRGHGGPVGFLTFSADGRKLLTGTASSRAGFPHEVITWDTKTWAEMGRSVNASDLFEIVAISADRALAVTADDHKLRTIKEFATGKQLVKLQVSLLDELGWTGYLSPCNRFFVSSGVYKKEHVLALFAVHSGELLFQVPDRYRLATMSYFHWAFGADGGAVALFAAEGKLQIWNTATGKLKRELAPAPSKWKESHGRTALAWSPNGKFLASWEECSGGVRVWNLATGKHRLYATVLPRRYDDFPPSLAWSADGRMFAIGGLGKNHNQIQVWEVATGRLRCEFGNHALEVRVLAFSPEGRLLASGSADTTILIWDLVGAQARPPSAGARLPKRFVAALINLTDYHTFSQTSSGKQNLYPAAATCGAFCRHQAAASGAPNSSAASALGPSTR
ncbi:MAG TPA: WD40 repeat domain-containing protein, partial [Gemmataceae bacterium]|nr:WD40 repeat domain-containing protein [Gemmataceae bacterium]